MFVIHKYLFMVKSHQLTRFRTFDIKQFCLAMRVSEKLVFLARISVHESNVIELNHELE